MFTPNETLGSAKKIRLTLKLNPLATRADAEAAMTTLADTVNRRRQLLARMDAELLRIRETFAPDVAHCDQEIAGHISALRVWAETNPREFARDKKSIALISGRLGFRTDTPSLALVNRTLTWTRVLGLVAAKRWRKFIRLKTEVDKDAILARCGTLQKPTKFQTGTLPALGLKLVQAENFFVEPDLTPE
jgi:phage host-nuclease inhibitor protein Gam